MKPRSTPAVVRLDHSRPHLLQAAVWFCSSFILHHSSFGTIPSPACVFYGEARDEYGSPYTTNATVILRVEGRECSRWTIDRVLAPGVNFRLSLELDDGQGSAYAPYAARPGQPVQISVLVRGIERTLVQTHALTAGQPGDFLGVYVTAGTDADGDGLPDEWERELLANSNGALSGIEQIRAEDDFDGDGVSNADEYRAGTYAFLADDYLQLEEPVRVASGKLCLRLLTSPGITYQVLGTGSLGSDAVWRIMPLTLTEQDTVPYQALVGNGYYTPVYVELNDVCRFFRLEAK